MTAYTDSLGFNKGSAAVPAIHTGRYGLLRLTLDFAKIAAARSAAGVAALTSSDTLRVIPVPAGAFVVGMSAILRKAEGAAVTIGLGDAAGDTTYLTTFSLNAAVGTVVAGSVTGKLYTAADNIYITLNHASIDLAIVDITVAIIDMS